MPVKISRKAILLSDNQFISGILPGIFLEHGLDTETSPELHDPAVLRTHISAEGNTSFLRKKFIDFIRSEGLPAIIALDLRLRSGLGDDPESLKLARTVAASCAFLAHAQGFENFRAHLLFVVDPKDPLLPDFARNPKFLLKGIKTTDSSLNSYLDELISDDRMYHSVFFTWVLQTDREKDEIIREMNIFLKGVLARLKFTRQEQAVPQGAAMHNGGDKPATVLLALPDGRVFADGVELKEEKDQYGKLEPDVITLSGLWNHRSQKEVTEKLQQFIKHGIPNEKKFRQDDEILILADERCVMDGSTAASAAGLLVRDLAQYKKIYLVVNDENADILRRSQGYNLIKEFIRYTE